MQIQRHPVNCSTRGAVKQYFDYFESPSVICYKCSTGKCTTASLHAINKVVAWHTFRFSALLSQFISKYPRQGIFRADIISNVVTKCLCRLLLREKAYTPGWLKTTEKKLGGVQDRVSSSFSCLNAPQSKSLFVLYKLSLKDTKCGLSQVKGESKHRFIAVKIDKTCTLIWLTDRTEDSDVCRQWTV